MRVGYQSVTKRPLFQKSGRIPSPAGYSTTIASSRPSLVSAREHCKNIVRTSDNVSYILSTFIPSHVRDAYFALHALNVEVSRVTDTTSNAMIAEMRMQFWRDSAKRALAGSPPPEPIAVLLAHAAEQLTDRSGGAAYFSLAWINRLIGARHTRLAGNRPFPDLDAMETYAEHTYSTLSYLILSAYPLASVTVDHLASHIGKATGIAALLRGLPATAFPSSVGGSGRQKQGTVVLPLDVMARVGLREEDLLRNGPNADGFADAVFDVATRASDHLITARTMLDRAAQAKAAALQGRDLDQDTAVDHPFEHQYDPDSRSYPNDGSLSAEPAPVRDYSHIERSFGALLPALSTQLWLDKLQRHNFDVFNSSLRSADWKLPLRAYLAYQKRRF